MFCGRTELGADVLRAKTIRLETIRQIDISKNPAFEFPVRASKRPTNHVPTKPPSAPQLLIKAMTSPATFLGSISGTMAKKGP